MPAFLFPGMMLPKGQVRQYNLKRQDEATQAGFIRGG
jgi:hypothetical protein